MKLMNYLKSVTRIAEFNIMGAYLYKNHHGSYKWVDTEKEKFDPLPLCQFWSHSKIEDHQLMLETLIHRPEIHRLFKSNIHSQGKEIDYKAAWQKEYFVKLASET